MDAVESAPKSLLGWPIKSAAQIWFNWIIPIALELLVYVVVIVADVAVTYQHFIDGNHLWAGLTLTFIWLPAILCFCSIITSPWNWPDYYYPGTPADPADDADDGASKQCLRFILILAFNVLLFPVGSLARFGRRLFWSIEALFHDTDSYERHHSLAKAAENSTFELYHFLQAFTQAAPQILLQLYILLREDIFRNYDTTTMQAISIVFSLLQMAIIAESYQRFESQKIVGRNYPWHPAELCQERKAILQRRTIAPPLTPAPCKMTSPLVMEFPDVMRGFNDKYPDAVPSSPSLAIEPENDRKTLHVDQNNFDIDKKSAHRKSSLDSIEVMGRRGHESTSGEPGIYNIEIDGHAEPISDQKHDGKKALPADVDKIKLLQSSPMQPDGQPPTTGFDGEQNHLLNNEPKMDEPKAINADWNMTKEQQLSKDYRHGRGERRRFSYLAEDVAALSDDHDDDYNFDTSPTSPPPQLPTSVLSPFNKILNYPLNRLSTITDMLLLDTELYVKDHVPRLPEKIARHEFKSHHLAATNPSNSIIIPGDVEAGGAVLEHSAAIKAHSTGYDLNGLEAAEDLATHRAPKTGDDQVDGNVLMMPRRRKMVVGLEQEDFFAKTVAFLGWTFFIMMRLLSLSVFATLHWREALYICLGHYLLMLGCILYEVNLHAKVQRLLFYLFLSYVYVFIILEFKIKFIHLRMWYGLYLGFVLTQNFVLSVWWYVAVMDFEHWWFDYLFRTILGSGVLSLCCLLVYYLRLKPKDKVLFELMEESDQDQQ